jgi:hypothetical protein
MRYSQEWTATADGINTAGLKTIDSQYVVHGIR